MNCLIRRSLIIGLISLLCSLTVSSQTWNPFWDGVVQGQISIIFTPKNSPVTVWLWDEMPEDYITYWDSVEIAYSSYTTYVSPSTTTYNCHGYAWYTSEYGNDPVWINKPFQEEFWNDGSYTSVSTPAGKIRFPMNMVIIQQLYMREQQLLYLSGGGVL